MKILTHPTVQILRFSHINYPTKPIPKKINPRPVRQIPQLPSQLYRNRFHRTKIAYPTLVPRPALTFLTSLLLLLPLPMSLLAGSVAQTPQVTVDLIAEPTPIEPGQAVTLGLRFRPVPGWHIYWKNPGDSGLPPSVTWKLPPGWTAGELLFPFPEKILAPPLISYGYEQETVLLVQLTPPSGQALPSKISITAEVDWLVCKEACLPGSASLQLTLPASPKPNIDLKKLFDEIRRELPLSVSDISVTATESKNILTLTLSPAPSVGQLSFFPDRSDYVDEFQPAQTEPSGNRSILRIPLKKKAPLPATISGLLVSEKPWVATGQRALEISVPLNATQALRSLGEGGSASPISLTLLFAFLGGLILNVMPCVFPILSLKALHLVQISNESPAAARREGLAYTLGVFLSLLSLAGLLIFLRASGQALGWGFQLQSPPVVWLLLALLFALSLNLLGVFEFQVFLSNFASKSPLQGWTGAFSSGLLAVAVASPCTAPFMGVALAAAFALPPIGTLLIFSSLALGFALPVLLLSLFPALLSFLPKPGSWMNSFKKILSLPMLAAVLWLVWVAFRLSGSSAAPTISLGLLLLGLGLFLFGKSQRSFPPPPALRWSGLALVLLAALIPASTLKTGSTELTSRHSDRLPWSEEEVSRQLQSGRTVFIDFTAAWCLTCQVNERVTLSHPDVQAAFREKNIAFLVADWTRRDPTITAALQKYGREGVPTYVLLRPDGSAPQLLPEIITPSIVLEALSH
jgi:thiol:disulfide interchange protein